MRGTRLERGPQSAPRRFIPAHAGNTGHQYPGTHAGTVHPRACGEHRSSSAPGSRSNGSSPRMRGTLRYAQVPAFRCRFIPAHAGNTSRWCASPRASAVHPRACGEHFAQRVVNRGKRGSSPRMRGTHTGDHQRCNTRRFIPAHAGNTRPSVGNGNRIPVHPRACGEHVKGNHHFSNWLRFIPAHAGNTPSGFSSGSHPAVHPRACGEHWEYHHWRFQCAGSSPRMRGTRQRCEVGGKSKSVHPRACGEHWNAPGALTGKNGSSPRMRGTRAPGAGGLPLSRFIPAHAGNTATARRSRTGRTVHPRACGEHNVGEGAFIYSTGSSPRMRGTHQNHCHA